MIINLTPHEIVVGEQVFPPSGSIARVTSTSVDVEKIDGLQLQTVKMGEPVGLPEAVDGTYLLVSAMVRAACPNRLDLLSPGEQVRNAAGQVTGCKTLIRNG